MKTPNILILSLLLIAGLITTACGTSEEEQNATVTRIAADVLATQTAGAPTPTPAPTETPIPTLTPTPEPTSSPTTTPPPSDTPEPTLTPTAKPALSEGVVSNIVAEEISNLLTGELNQGPVPDGAVACFQSESASEVGFSYSAWSPDEKHLATVLGEIEFGPVKGSKIIIWDMTTLKPLTSLEGQSPKIYRIAWSPDGSRLAAGSSEDRLSTEGFIHVWDMTTYELAHTLTLDTGWPDIMAWSPDGTRLASKAGENGIIIWNVETGEVSNSRDGHDKRIVSLAWSPDGTRLASGSVDHTITTMSH
jgi:WD40 repeat protein